MVSPGGMGRDALFAQHVRPLILHTQPWMSLRHGSSHLSCG